MRADAGDEASRGTFRRLLGELLEDRGTLAAAVASLLGLSASQLYLTWITKRWVQEGIVPRDPEAILRLSALSAAIAVVMVAMLFASSYLLARIHQDTIRRLRARMQERLLASTLPSLARFPAGDLVSRMLNDCAALSGFAEAVLKRIVGEGFLLVGAVVLMFVLEWRLAAAIFVAGPPVAWLIATLGRAIRRRGLHAQRELGALAALFGEQLAGTSTIKGFGAEAHEGARFRERNDAQSASVLRGEWWTSALLASVWMATALALVLATAYGGLLVASGRLSEGVILSFCLYAVQTVEPARRLGEVYGRLQRALASAERVYEVIDLRDLERGGERAAAAPVRGEIAFDGVGFSYAEGPPVLADLRFTLRRGERVAIVAASGGGKTTLARLLVRFLDPRAGTIALDGTDLRELRLDVVRGAVTVVEQEPFVFAGSVLDNVRYGSWQATRDEVEAAIRRAGLGRWLDDLEGGLDGALLEAGRNLSGGQKSRLALARAIVRDPAVLVLDETTSAVDGAIEAQIFAEIADWLAQRTVIVMAHRLSTVSLCGRVLLLDGGRLAAEGTVADLIATSPPFARLFADQLRQEPAPIAVNSRS